MKSLDLKNRFIEKSKEKFGPKFLFNKVNYVNYHMKVIITCPSHGDMEMTPDAHIKSKYGCKECARISAPVVKEGETSPVKTTEQFIAEATELHKGKYDYSNTIYKNRLTPISIICPVHGEFTLPQASRHLEGRGCRKCFHDSMFLSQAEYLDQARLVHKDIYDYSDSIYTGKRNDINVTCKIHGSFIVNAGRHTRGVGCKACKKLRMKLKGG